MNYPLISEDRRLKEISLQSLRPLYFRGHRTCLFAIFRVGKSNLLNQISIVSLKGYRILKSLAARRMGLPIAFLMVLLVVGMDSNVQAREVKMEEVSVSLYNRPATGYRVLLDRNTNIVRDQILSYISIQEQSPPFKFEQTLIYENIRYQPISMARDLSLYFMVHDLEGHFTELTLVVMYDYKRSISTRDFPALSLKVQAELARLVRRVTGDILRSDRLVFDDQTLSNLKDSFGSEKDPGPLVENFQEEEVENNGILLHDDPFAKEAPPVPSTSESNPSTSTEEGSGNGELKRLKARILELELREKQLLSDKSLLEGDQVILERRQERLMEKLKENRQAWDSVAVLNERVEEMMGHYYLADDFSVSSETALQMQELEKSARKNGLLLQALKLENDSLQASNGELKDLLTNTSLKARDKAKEIRKLERDNKGLQKQNDRLTADLQIARARTGNQSTATVDSLLASAKTQKTRLDDTEHELSNTKVQLSDLERKFRAAEDQQSRLESRLEELETVNRSLTKENSNLLTTLAEGGTIKTPAPNRDSLNLLLQEISQLKTRLNANANSEGNSELESALQLKDQALRQAKSKLSDTQKDLTEAEKRNSSLQSRFNQTLLAKEKAEADLAALSQGKELSAREKRQLTNQLTQTQQDLANSQASETQLLDTIARQKEFANQLKLQIRQRNLLVNRLQDSSDSLNSLLRIRNQESALLRNQVDQLERDVDSLQQITIPGDDQGAFIREQWVKLQDWEGKLKTREADITDREKLLLQREDFLAEQEGGLKAREAKLTDLEAREERLKILEQSIKAANQTVSATNNPGSFRVRDGKVMEFGETVPVFIADTDLDLQTAQRRMVAYMLQRNELLNEQFPDIFFAGATLPELSADPIDIRIRIDTKGARGSTIQISFKLQSGNYIGPSADRNLAEVARQLVARMIRFNF